MKWELIVLDVERMPSGRLFGQSKELPGIDATGDGIDALISEAAQIIAQIYGCRNQSVAAYEIPHLRSDRQIWFAAVPTEVVERRMAA